VSAPPCPLDPFVPVAGLPPFPGILEVDTQLMITAACTANVGARVDVAPGVPITFTLRVGGVDTSTSCQILAGGTSCFSSVGTPVVAGGLVNLHLTGTTFGSATRLWVGAKCQ